MRTHRWPYGPCSPSLIANNTYPFHGKGRWGSIYFHGYPLEHGGECPSVRLCGRIDPYASEEGLKRLRALGVRVPGPWGALARDGRSVLPCSTGHRPFEAAAKNYLFSGWQKPHLIFKFASMLQCLFPNIFVWCDLTPVFLSIFNSW